MYFSIFLSILSFLLSQAVADTSKSFCITKYGPSSTSSIPTLSNIISKTWTYTKRTTITPTITVFPPPTTIITTATATDTVVVTTTGTITSTRTSTRTITQISTTLIVTTTTSTTTVSGSTSTVPTVSGFTPVASQTDYVPKKRSPLGNLEARASATGSSTALAVVDGELHWRPTQYPTAVDCEVLAITKTTVTKTKTATNTAMTTVPAYTTTVTTTITTTTTSTAAANPVTVITTSATTTTTTRTTSVATSTVTQTVVAPEATLYAACLDPANYISRANGGLLINELYGTGDILFATAPETDAYSCCAACQARGDCVASTLDARFCLLGLAEFDCNINLKKIAYTTAHNVSADDAMTISNGVCAQLFNGGTTD